MNLPDERSTECRLWLWWNSVEPCRSDGGNEDSEPLALRLQVTFRSLLPIRPTRNGEWLNLANGSDQKSMDEAENG
jgi:hypothetical protein